MATTETLTVDKGVLTYRTVTDEAKVVQAKEIVAMDDGVAREILIVENEIRAAQARLAALQARKTKTAALAAEALVKVPPIEEKPLGGVIK